jgi:hypothetical protein
MIHVNISHGIESPFAKSHFPDTVGLLKDSGSISLNSQHSFDLGELKQWQRERKVSQICLKEQKVMCDNASGANSRIQQRLFKQDSKGEVLASIIFFLFIFFLPLHFPNSLEI